MAKRQVTFISLGLVAVTSKKRMTSENDSHSSTSSSSIAITSSCSNSVPNRNAFLSYCKLLNGGFCLPCVIFARATHDLAVLVNGAMKTFYKATEILRRHGTSYNIIKNSMGYMVSFLDIMEQRTRSDMPMTIFAHDQPN